MNKANPEASTPPVSSHVSASRSYLLALTGWSSARLDGYLQEQERLDSKRGSKKQCGAGYACGTTCISREKVCRVTLSPATKEKLRSMMTGGAGKAQTALGTTLHGPDDDGAQLRLRRDQLVSSGLNLIRKRRPGSSATMGEHPTPEVVASLQQLDRRVRRVDAELSAASGGSGKRRRWQKGAPGLVEFKGFMGPPHPDTPGRVAYRKELIEGELAKGSKEGRGEGGRPLAVVMMGGPGSGKSTMLKRELPDKKGFVNVDPDGFKEKLPEYLLAVANSDKLAAARAHEESSTMIADVLKKRAIEGGYNVILDGTGKNGPKYEAMIKDLKTRGYEVRLMMPHLPKDEGVKRVRQRAHRNGRFVPTEVVTDAYDSIPRNFEKLAKLADSAVLRDATSMDSAGKLTMEPIMAYKSGRIVNEEATKAAQFRRQHGGA